MSRIRISVATLEVCVRCSRCFTAPLGTPVRPSWRRRWWRRRGRRRGRRRRASRAVTAQRRQRGADVDPVDRQATERHGIQLKTERWLLRGAVDRVRHLEGCWRRGHHASCIGQRHICSGAVEAGDPRILVAAQAPSVRGIEKPGRCTSQSWACVGRASPALGSRPGSACVGLLSGHFCHVAPHSTVSALASMYSCTMVHTSSVVWHVSPGVQRQQVSGDSPSRRLWPPSDETPNCAFGGPCRFAAASSERRSAFSVSTRVTLCCSEAICWTIAASVAGSSCAATAALARASASSAFMPQAGGQGLQRFRSQVCVLQRFLYLIVSYVLVQTDRQVRQKRGRKPRGDIGVLEMGDVTPNNASYAANARYRSSWLCCNSWMRDRSRWA